MFKGNPMNRVVWRLVACAAVFCSPTALRADNPTSDRNVKQAFTLPFKEYKISFPTMGVIKEVKVKEGDVIKKGDMIMKQDDSEDKAELRLLELDVNEYPIKAAEFKLEAAEADFQ